MPRGGGQDLPAQERSPRRKPPDTAHGRKDLPRARTLSSAKASRHGARAKGFAPRRNAPLGEGLPTRRTGERICPAQERSPRRRPLDTAHERKDLPRAETLSSAKASRHGARAKGFAPRESAPHGEGLPIQRTGERICPARERSPRRRPPDTAHQRKDLPAQEHAPRRRPPDTAHQRKDLPHGGSRSPRVPTNGGPLPTDEQPEKHPFGGVAPTARGRCRVHSPKKIRLLHEIQLFYGESHVGSRQIFPSFPSVGRCVARERNPVPPFAPHRGRGHRGLRRDGEMHHGFSEMVRRFGECPRGGKSLPRAGNAWLRGGGRYCPGFRCFGERFHRHRCANPDACGGRRCSRG